MAIEVTDDPRLPSHRRSRRPSRPTGGQRPGTEVARSLFPEEQPGVRGLHTVAMMAAVLRVPPAAIRHWQRCGLLEPSRRSTAVAWFEFSELVVARQLARLLRTGLSPSDIADQLSRLVPGGARAAAHIADRIVVEGRRLLLRSDGRLLGAGGQLQLGFAAPDIGHAPLEEPGQTTAAYADEAAPDAADEPATVAELLDLAADLEASGALAEAAEALRAVLQAQGPTAQVAFMLAEVLYRSGDLTAARERYYATIELDADHLEARSSLGCVLAELGEHDLALAALEGVVRQEPRYADAHWHLAAILRDAGREPESLTSLRTFLTLAPESPWATMAQERLAAAATPAP
ncbi:MAG: hypothetical protein RLZZ111_1732 [Planctomycetota bacterium]|jgi:tetratricopeptide (TPR) repeat protein